MQTATRAPGAYPEPATSTGASATGTTTGAGPGRVGLGRLMPGSLRWRAWRGGRRGGHRRGGGGGGGGGGRPRRAGGGGTQAAPRHEDLDGDERDGEHGLRIGGVAGHQEHGR